MEMNEIPEGFKMTDLGPLPKGWGVFPLGDISKIITGNTPSKKNPENYGDFIPLIKPPELNEGKVSNSTDKLSEEGSLHARILPPNSTLVSCIGTLGKTGINTIPVAFNQQINAIIFGEWVDPMYGFYYSQTLKDWLNAIASKTTLPIVSKSKFKLAPIALPLPPEQRKIAAVLSTVQEAREKTEAVSEASKALKKSLMKHLFTYGPVPIDEVENVPLKETEIGLIPEGWDVLRLNEVCTKIIDCPHSTPRFCDSGVLVVRNFNIRNGHLNLQQRFYTSEEEYKTRIKRCEPRPGDVLFSREAPIGEACLIPPNTKLSLGQRTMLLRTNPTQLDNYFLVQALYSTYVRETMMALATGVTAKHLNVADVRRLEIPLPPFPIQQEMSSIISAVNLKIEAEENKKTSLEEIFRTLLHNLMTAKIRANHLELQQ